MLYDPKWKKEAEVKEEEWRNILRKAAKLLQRKRWLQQELENVDKSGYCMIGVIQSVAFGDTYDSLFGEKNGPEENKIDPDTMKNYRKAIGAVARLVPTVSLHYPSADIFNWNDNEGRKKKEVVAKLKEAADAFEIIDE